MNKTCHLIIDTNIIFSLLYGEGKPTKNLILDYAKAKEICFNILDTNVTEWINVEYAKHHRKIRYRDQLSDALSHIGTVAEIPVMHDSKAVKWAQYICSLKKYIRPLSRQTLSQNDCILLSYALENPWTLVTLDTLLIRAYCAESRTIGRKMNLLVTEDYVWDDECR